MSPQLGRFLSRDPVGYKGGENLYGYVQENPRGFVDPVGMAGTSSGCVLTTNSAAFVGSIDTGQLGTTFHTYAYVAIVRIRVSYNAQRTRVPDSKRHSDPRLARFVSLIHTYSPTYAKRKVRNFTSGPIIHPMVALWTLFFGWIASDRSQGRTLPVSARCHSTANSHTGARANSQRVRVSLGACAMLAFRTGAHGMRP